jgi:hypothetical protein
MVKRLLRRVLGRDVLCQVLGNLERLELQTRAAMAMTRALVTRSDQPLDPTNPDTWEFCGFSQHGEDGIIEHLCCRLTSKKEFFFEIGASDGTQNCTASLAFARQYRGIIVEGDEALLSKARHALQDLNWGDAIRRAIRRPDKRSAIDKALSVSRSGRFLTRYRRH